jgi:DNA-binding MarR family transcriptional regulator
MRDRHPVSTVQRDDGPDLLREVARLHVRAQRTLLGCDGASSTTCTILTELGRSPSMKLAELARRLRIDKGWTSRAVDQLVDLGYVDKSANDIDRRTIALSLTRAGRAEHRRIEGLLNAQVARVMMRLPAAQRRAVSDALSALLEAYRLELTQTDNRTECAEAS